MNRLQVACGRAISAAMFIVATLYVFAAEPIERGLDGSTERLIIVTIANDVAPAIRAGSTSRGYGVAPYQTSTEARKVTAAIARKYGLRTVRMWPIAMLHVHCIVFEIPLDRSRLEILKLLALEKRIALAEPMQTFETLSQHYNDPYVILQHGFEQIEGAQAQEWSSGRGVRVAIIDTGIDLSHPDLLNRVVLHRNFVDADDAQFRRDRHGTEVAGVIAAVANNREGIVGVAPQVKLLALKACRQVAPDRDDARCSSITLAQALVAAMDANAQIVNLSLSGPPDPLLAELVAHAARRGIVFIGAMAAKPVSVRQFPAQTPGVIGVGVLEAPPAAGLHPLLAPGREILTLLPGGRYDFASGASLAAAHVTGTVALLLAKSPHLNPLQIHSLLIATGSEAGAARTVNACRALNFALGQSNCEPVRSAQR